MQSTPKKILITCLTFGSLSMALFTVSCKSEKSALVQNSENSAVAEASPEARIDSAKLLRMIREKNAEIAGYQPSAKRDFDLLHTELDLAFDWSNQAVIGRAKLKLTPYFYPQKELVLDAKDFEVGAIYLLNGEAQSKLNYRYDEKQLRIYLPELFNSKDTIQVEINYIAFPDRNSGSGSEAITDTKGLYFIDPLDTIPGKPTMIWTQGETEHNSKWFPTIDKPNERFTQLFKLTVPDSMVSISNGVLVKQEKLENGLRKDYWEMKLPHAPYLAAIAVGNFGKVEAKWKNIPLGYYVEKGFEKGAAMVFENTPEMIGLFEEKLGVDFPWPKYDQIVVRDFVSGAMENTTASIFMEELRLDEREAIDSEWDYIIAHELFHQWFGDLVTAESWANLTLNEAFANYSEYLWNEHKYGQDQAALKLVTEMEGYFAESESKQVDLIRFNYADSEDMFDSHSYNKGGVVLHMLRQHLGDEAFFKGLNLYLKQYAFQSVEIHDLRLAFERVSGQDLNWFFNQWFLDKGHPELFFEVDYSQPENILLTVYQVQDLENLPLYQLPIEVSWYEGKSRKSKKFQMTSSFQQFALENEFPVNQIYIDEGKNLLARRNQEISTAQYAIQFKESTLGVARYEALDSLVSREAKDYLIEILPIAVRDSFWSVRENALGFMQNDPEWRSQIQGLEDMVYELAEKDPKNSVKAAAIDLLAAWDPDKYQSAFLRLANEQSYLVASSALMGLVRAEENPVDAAVIERFVGERNFRMIIPVAEYYILQNVKGKGPWFLDRVDQLSGEGLYFYLGYFSEYFSRFPEEGKDQAVRKLFLFLEKDSKSFVRLGAFQALMGFADEEAVIKKLNQVVLTEKDEKLKNYYNYFLEALN
ncbi:MAG: M1 family metallopeptidase [Algoriphagus sp.]|uniref:M1 family metallopeptidase n=3 Tax=Algoriphagus sp. TaxID=1872435 RepID=UPI0027358FD6|nr:M1 family metallopeptidase [Algoriphagus sp.]MDP3472791.1 M1 family metallopeptidase [Algoriphagus sp.]